MAIAAVLAVLHGAVWIRLWVLSMDPAVFNEDALQQIYPFFAYADPELFPDDYARRYYLDCFPLGYWLLYVTAAHLGDVVTVSKVLPYLLGLTTLVAVLVASARLGGRWSALVSGTLVLGCAVFMARMAGGLPRAFAFPLLALGLAALCTGRVRLLAVLVPAAAAFYPLASFILGLCLFGTCLLLPASDRGEASSWSRARRLRLVAASALATVAVVAIPARGAAHYGAAIRPSMVDTYPEIGPGGRYTADHRAPFEAFTASFPRVAGQAVRTAGEPFVRPVATWLQHGEDERRPSPRRTVMEYLLFALTLAGVGILARREPAARRALLLLLAAMVGHVVARHAAPYFYLPFRYVAYPVSLAVVVFLPAGVLQLGRTLAPRRAAPVVTGALALGLVVLLGRAGSDDAGLGGRAAPGDKLLDGIAALPPNVTIAAMPRGPINYVPYVSRRQAFLTYELHQVFHVDYAQEMRRRMRALLDAHFATEVGPLVRLRDEHGATHLLVRTAHLRGDPPTYFRPFDTWIDEARRLRPGQTYEVLRQRGSASVLEARGHFLLDLHRLTED